MAGVAVRALRIGQAELQIVLTRETPKEFLLSLPRGAYTTARTIKQTRLVEYDLHMNRMASSLATMSFGTTESPEMTEALRPYRARSTLEPLLLPVVQRALERFQEAAPPQEARITLLLGWDDAARGVLMAAHVSALPDQQLKHVTCDVLGAPRTAASVKDSQWVRDRAALERRMSPGAHEALLQHDDALYEGLTSNFFAVEADGTVVTAPEGAVLRGTVQTLVLRRCEALGIPVRIDLPRLSDAPTWSGAFLTSTSRVVLPISMLRFEDGRVVDIPTTSAVVQTLQRDVRQHMEDESKPIL